MSNELEFLSRYVAKGKLSRRDFLGRAAALGVTATFANSLLSSAVRAEGPVKGGIIKAGLVGGESTNTLDPALALTQVMQVFNKQWGEMIVELAPDGAHRKPDRRGDRLLRRRQDLDAEDPRRHRVPQRQDGDGGGCCSPPSNAIPMRKSKSGALGYMKGFESIKASGKEVIITLKEPNADLPYLLTDYHLPVQPNGGKDDPAAGISAGPYKVTVNEPGVRHGGERFANYWQGDKMGHADQVEIIVINDATARISALQGGQVNMINRVEPKIVDLIKRVPGVTIRNYAGPGHYVFIMHCNTRAVRQQRSAGWR